MDREPPQSDANPGDRPFQFGLRTMLLAVAACGALFAVMSRVSFAWNVTITWIVLLVVAHVAANVWGTRVKQRRRDPADDAPPASMAGNSIEFAPQTRLGDNRRLGRMMFVFTGIGAVAGCALGTTALLLLYFGQLDYLGIAIGAFSAAVIGGFLGFLTSTFLTVSMRALNEAAGERTRRR